MLVSLRGLLTGGRFRWRVSTTGRIANGRRRLHAAIKNSIRGAIVGAPPRMPRHQPKASPGCLPDREQSPAINIELHIGASLAPAPLAGDAPGRAAHCLKVDCV